MERLRHHQHLKKKEEIVAIRKEHANEVSGMAKKIEDLEAIVNLW